MGHIVQTLACHNDIFTMTRGLEYEHYADIQYLNKSIMIIDIFGQSINSSLSSEHQIYPRCIQIGQFKLEKKLKRTINFKKLAIKNKRQLQKKYTKLFS